MEKRNEQIPLLEWASDHDGQAGTSAPRPLLLDGVDQAVKRGKRVPWSEEEDQKLMSLAEADKKKKPSWKQVAAQMPGRTAAACKYRYNNMKRKSKAFSKEEDGRICNAVAESGSNWNSIEGLLPGRSRKEIRKRWRELVKSGKIDPALQPASSQEIREQDVPRGSPSTQPPGQENVKKDVVKSGKIDPALQPALSEITEQDVRRGYPSIQPPGQEKAKKDVPLLLVSANAKREGFASRFLRVVNEWRKKVKWWRWK